MRVSRLVVSRVAFGVALGFAAVTSGCRPEIGDKCQVSTDCSVRGDRLCDSSQPGGYCTQFNCRANGCPEEATCVLFNSALPGCGFDDRAGPLGSRVARSFCMARCESSADCRTSEGYACADPRTAPWSGRILDDDQSARACLPVFADVADGGAGYSAALAPVCAPAAPVPPPIDAGAAGIADAGPAVPPLFTDAAAPDAGQADAGDAGNDASDGG